MLVILLTGRGQSSGLASALRRDTVPVRGQCIFMNVHTVSSLLVEARVTRKFTLRRRLCDETPTPRLFDVRLFNRLAFIGVHDILLLTFVDDLLVLFETSRLILLVLSNEVLQVGLCFAELHLVHSFASVPVQECFSPEHECKLFRGTLEESLDGSGVGDEGSRHLETWWCNVTQRMLDVVGDPLHEQVRLTRLDVLHCVLHCLSSHVASEDCRHGEIFAQARVDCCHETLRVEALLSQFGDAQLLVGPRTGRDQGSKGASEEVQTWEWDHVDSHLSQVRVERAWESECRGAPAHGRGNDSVEVCIARLLLAQCPLADVVQGFVVEAEGQVGVLDEVVNGERGVVRLNDGV